MQGFDIFLSEAYANHMTQPLHFEAFTQDK